MMCSLDDVVDDDGDIMRVLLDGELSVETGALYRHVERPPQTETNPRDLSYDRLSATQHRETKKYRAQNIAT